MKNIKVTEEAHQMLRIAAALQAVNVWSLATEAVLSYCRSIVGDTAIAQLRRKAEKKTKRGAERRKPRAKP